VLASPFACIQRFYIDNQISHLCRQQTLNTRKAALTNELTLLTGRFARYASGNFAPVTEPCPPTPCQHLGTIPREFYGGQYVRNGSNPASNPDSHSRDYHWFDGDGMLSGVVFQTCPEDPERVIPHFSSQYVLTDAYLSSKTSPQLRSPILPSLATLLKWPSAALLIVWKIIRTAVFVVLSYLPGSGRAIHVLSVANTAVLFHDGRALATCRVDRLFEYIFRDWKR
jgi:hypothetical protein